MKQGQPKVPAIPKFLSKLASQYYKSHGVPLKVGIDPYVHSASFAKELNEAFDKAAEDIDISSDDEGVNGDTDGDAATKTVVVGTIDTLDGKPNLVDLIWEGRPELPKNPFRVHVSDLEIGCSVSECLSHTINCYHSHSNMQG
jgi:Xaa-Pro aminopeptidase